jgi:hypothetical protein
MASPKGGFLELRRALIPMLTGARATRTQSLFEQTFRR